MNEKSTISVEKATRDIFKTVKRKMSYEMDKDLTTDEALIELCATYINNHKEDKDENNDVEEKPDDERQQKLPEEED